MPRIDAQWQERRSQRLHVRVSPDFKTRLERAAREVEMSVSDFVVRAVSDRVEHVLGDGSAGAGETSAQLVDALGVEATQMVHQMAAAEGASRDEVVRRLLGRALAGVGDDLAADLAALDASFGAYPDIEITPRGVDERARHLASVRADED
ncbi:DUF1778 domain-containing protein [Phytoactinopolyspora limicola]|uniref:type II toxin -antitoxin system TacA 1-like antitoxin n=1 Tax=Phytoactinopolyspora limicola TaxID=2715536 RepID=UPI00140A86DE|nr:DUF1778 domain-containing protein [Phytoactinopolyspora limicola]